MSAEVQPMQSASSTPLKMQPGQAYLIGRVEEVKRTQDGMYTVLKTAAVDSYSFPGLHEVQSKNRLGQIGDDVRVLVRLTGFRGRAFQNRSGEMQPGFVRNLLVAVED